MRLRTILLPLAGLLMLAACAGAPGTPEPESKPSAAAAAPAPFALSEVPPHRLLGGQCALVLWSREPSPRRLVLALDNPAIARINRNGAVSELAQTGVEGRRVFGHHPVQYYAGGGVRLTLRISFDGPQTLADGAILRDGSVELADDAGWSEIIPAAGLIGCQQ